MPKKGDEPKAHWKEFAQYLRDFFESEPKVTRMWDEGEHSFVDFFFAADTPEDGVTTCVTLGLQDDPNAQRGGARPELLLSGPADLADLDGPLAAAAILRD